MSHSNTNDISEIPHPIDLLWHEVENETWLLFEVARSARELGYFDSKYDEQFASHTNFEYSHKNPENNYWMRNATFALLILAAEGEL